MQPRELAPAQPAITSGELAHALTVARWVDSRRNEAEPGAAKMARALIYLYEELQSERVIRVGDTIKVSVALLRDLFDMPGHTSAVVRFIRSTAERDGSRLLLLQAAEQPWKPEAES